MADFDGFPEDTLAFLADLSLPENNNKPWFDANRKRYQEVYVAPAKAFVEAVGERLHSDFSPDLNAIPSVQKGSMMRINRDIRFSQDKRPYKDHMDLMFWHGPGKPQTRPGLGFRLTATELHTVGGLHGMDKDVLAAYRSAVDDEATGQALQDIVDGAQAAGIDPGEPDLKTVPRGFDKDHPRSDLMRRKGLFLAKGTALPPEVHSAALVDVVCDRYQPLWPLVQWLAAVVDASE